MLTAPPPAAFARHVVDVGDCALWVGQLHGGFAAYQAGHGKPRRMVHRLVWEEAHGPLCEGQHLFHRCGVRNCVRLEHLAIGSYKEQRRAYTPYAASDTGQAAESEWVERR